MFLIQGIEEIRTTARPFSISKQIMTGTKASVLEYHVYNNNNAKCVFILTCDQDNGRKSFALIAAADHHNPLHGIDPDAVSAISNK